MAQGIETDQCFYIQNERKVRGKKRLDLTIDPPLDLALEIDITSRTHPSIYQALQVPELWRFDRGKLQINLLKDGVYVESTESFNFPNLPLVDVIPQYLEQSRTAGRNATMRAFRQWVKEGRGGKEWGSGGVKEGRSDGGKEGRREGLKTVN